MVGGQSRDDGKGGVKYVLVNPSGEVVGSAYPGGGGSSSRKSSSSNAAAKRAAEEAARQKILEAARKAAEEAKRQEELKRERLRKALLESKLSSILLGRSKRTGQAIQAARALEEELSTETIQKLRTKELRGNATTKDKLKLAGASFAAGLLSNGLAVIELPKVLNEVRKNPSIVKKLPGAIRTEGAKFGQLARQSPASATGRVVAELISFKGISKAAKTTSELGTFLRAGGKVKPGQTIKLGSGAEAIDLKVVGNIPGESVAKQIGRAGGTSRVATSSQANKLVGLIKGGKIVRKPLGTTKAGKKIEDVLSTAGKRRLVRFDKGNISPRDLVSLDREVKIKGGKGILERSFFADPAGRVRPSRLGVEKEKPLSLYESISEDITFRKSKPQVLVFKDAQIEKLPRSLQGIKNKLRAGKPLTNLESAKLVQFQLKRSGKFKPLGFVSKESEITLAPGELIRRKRVLGSINVRGRRVPIVKVEVYRPKANTKKLITKLRNKKITKKEIAQLNRRLKKETGLDYKLSSSSRSGGRYVSLKKSAAKAIISSSPRLNKSSRKGGRSSPRTRSGGSSGRSSPRTRKSGSSKSPIRRSPKSGSSYGSSGRSPLRTGKSGRSIILTKPKGYSPRILPRQVNTYYVVHKVGGQYRKLYPKPLTATDARDFAVYAIDNKLSKTAFLVPLGKASRVVSVPKAIQGYYGRNSRKVRPYRIRFGKKRQLVNGYIEKRPYFRDTPGENRALRLAKLRAKKSKPMSSKRRQELLKRLKKARAARMRNLKRRK